MHKASLKKEGKHMKTYQKTLIIAEISILAALALALDYLAQITTGTLYPYGGSISIAMVPIMVISFRRGIIAGVTTGLIVGTIQIIWGGHFLQFFQYILDYPVPYAVVGFAGILKFLYKKLSNVQVVLGAIIAGLLRYLSHYLAGVIFWGAYAPEEFKLFGKTIKGFNPNTWSIFYNGLYMIPTIIISTIVLVALFIYAKQLFEE